MEYADISELDDKVQYIKVTWRKMINYASVFTKEFRNGRLVDGSVRSVA